MALTGLNCQERRLFRLRPRPPRRGGFTLVELVVTLVVLGILAVTVMPRFADKDLFEQRGFYDQLKASLQFARKAAIAKRRYVCVRFTGGDASFSVDLRAPESSLSFCDGVAGHEADLKLPTVDKKCTAANKICSPPSVTSLAAVSTTLVFDALGRTAAASFAVSGQADISIEGETGYVH